MFSMFSVESERIVAEIKIRRIQNGKNKICKINTIVWLNNENSFKKLSSDKISENIEKWKSNGTYILRQLEVLAD